MSAIVQVESDLLAADTTTTATDPLFTPLLSVPLTTVGGDLLVWFTGAIDVINAGLIATLEFRLLLDGASQSATSVCVFSTFTSAPRLSTCLTGVSAGAHTVAIEWGLAPGSPLTTARCRPVTVPNQEHASLVVAEVLQ